MKWPAEIVSTVVEHLIAADVASGGSIACDLKSQVEEALRQRAEAWQREQQLLKPEEYREKYDLSKEEMKTARELTFLKIISSKEQPTPLSPFLPLTLYQDIPLTTAQRQQVQQTTYLSTRKAAEYLAISVATFKKLRIPASVPPWNQQGAYSGTFYRISDLLKHKGITETKKKPTAIQQKQWNKLNQRQQAYLLCIYREEHKKEPYYTSYKAMNDPQKKGGEWRWCEHDTRSLYETGLDAKIAQIGELDQGTGSTYETLDRRGLIERRHNVGYNLAGQRITLLDVRLTRKGRTLAKAFSHEIPELLKTNQAEGKN